MQFRPFLIRLYYFQYTIFYRKSQTSQPPQWEIADVSLKLTYTIDNVSDTFSADRRDGERIPIMIIPENRRGHSVPEHIPIKSISQKAFTQKNKKSFGKIIEKEITLWYTKNVRAYLQAQNCRKTRRLYMRKVQFTETVLRDANQSLMATRLPYADYADILPAMDKAGYYSIECWGGATFDSC